MTNFASLIKEGVDYPEFIAQGNDEQIQHLLREQAKTERSGFINDRLKAKIDRITGRYTLLVAAEMWCPDCLRNVPAFQALCHLLPHVEMRIITRDQAAPLFQREFHVEKVSIPFVAILDSADKPIGTFIERPQSVKNGDENTILAYKRGECLADAIEDIVTAILDSGA